MQTIIHERVLARAACAALLAGALACGGDGPTPPVDTGGIVIPTNPPLTGGTPTTSTVTVTLEQGSAASKTIDVAGGTVVAHGSKGATFTLTVPPGALLLPTEITVTPVASMSGNDVAGAATAAAALAPSGLQLLQVATLRIDLPAAPAASTVGIGYSGAGEDFHLVPAKRAAATSAFELPVSHFSGAGVAAPAPAAVNALAQQLAATPQARLEQQLGAVLGKMADGQTLSDADVAQVQGLFRDYYAQVVKPRLVAAQTDDAQLAAAVQSYFSWARAMALLGLDLPAERGEGLQLVISAMVNHYRKAYGRCAQKHDFTQVKEMVSVIRFLELLGAGGALPPGGIAGAEGCAAMRLEFTSSIQLASTWSWQTRGQVPLPLHRSAGPVQAQGPHTVVSFSHYMFPTCAKTYSNTDGQIVVTDFAFEPDSTGIKNVSLAYDPLIGGPSSTVTVTCASSPVSLPAFYGGDFVVLHADEFRETPLPVWYVTSGWEEGTGDVLWRRRYSRTVSGRTEETELVIRHTPEPQP